MLASASPTAGRCCTKSRVMTLTTSVVICAYTEGRWEPAGRGGELGAGAAASRSTRSSLVIDHNDALLARAPGSRARRPRCWPNAVRQGLSGARNTGIDAVDRRHRLLPRRRRGGRAGLERAPADRSVRGPGRPRGRRRRRARLGDGGRRPGGRRSSAGSWAAAIAGSRRRLSPVRNLMGCNMSLRRSVLAGGRWLRHRARPPRRQPAGLRGDRALHPGADSCFPTASSCIEPAAVVHHHVPGRAGVLALLPGPLPGRGHLQGAGGPPGGSGRPRWRARPATSGGCCRPGVLTNLGRSLHGDLAGARPSRRHRGRARR